MFDQYNQIEYDKEIFWNKKERRKIIMKKRIKQLKILEEYNNFKQK
jgi:hypothetical protein